MSLTQLLVPTFTQFLRGLSSWLGKADYVSYMLAYLRPGTMPKHDA